MIGDVCPPIQVCQHCNTQVVKLGFEIVGSRINEDRKRFMEFCRLLLDPLALQQLIAGVRQCFRDALAITVPLVERGHAPLYPKATSMHKGTFWLLQLRNFLDGSLIGNPLCPNALCNPNDGCSNRTLDDRRQRALLLLEHLECLLEIRQVASVCIQRATEARHGFPGLTLLIMLTEHRMYRAADPVGHDLEHDIILLLGADVRESLDHEIANLGIPSAVGQGEH